MTALIDADSLIYRVGFVSEEKLSYSQYDSSCNMEDFYYTDLFLACNQLDKTIESIRLSTDCDDVMLVFSGKGNFRFEVDTTYKHNRVNRKPSGYQDMLNHLLSGYQSLVTEGYEADDYVVYMKTNYPDKYILCAIDKDVLMQTVGTHFNYMKQEWVTVTQEMATEFFWYQVIVGDVTDGYKGLPGAGKVYATNLLNAIKVEKLDYYKTVKEAYEGKGFTEKDMLVSMRLASMHQLAPSPDGIGLTVQLVSYSVPNR